MHYVEKREILSHQKFFPSNQLCSNFYRKNVNFTKFLSTLYWIVEKRETLCHVEFFSSNQFRDSSKVKKLIWRKFCDNIMHSEEIAEILSHTFLAKISWN